MTTFVSSNTLPTVFIDLLAAFVDYLLQLGGLFRRERASRANKNRLALLLADPFEPVYEIGSHFQPGWRQHLQILDEPARLNPPS
jgi:hypothetical protein